MKKENLILGAVLIVVVSFFGYRYYTNTPEYLAQQHYDAGLGDLESRQFESGIEHLSLALNSHTGVSAKARQTLNALMQEDYLNSLSLEESVQVLRLLLPIKKSDANYFQIVEARFTTFAEDQPYLAGQLALLAAQASTDEQVVLAYKQKAYDLLYPKISLLKEDKNLAMDFALLDEELNACGSCVAILENFRGDLGDHEAARALGQYYAAANEVEEAFALLEPYVKSRLAQYHEAERFYNATLDEIWDEAIEDLNKGLASDTFYESYEKADEAQQNELVNQFYSEKLEKSRKVDEALEKYQSAAAIVPVALDLGIVRLGRAMSMSNADERQAELAAAESVFLAVKSFAGESDDYQLYLGQIYYWLGKENEGDTLFTALINKYDRSDGVLSSIASVLRDLGAKTKATAYIDEAYEKAQLKENKQAYAYQRYLLSSELDERIEWLEKCDQSTAYVMGDLFAAKAERAERDNNKKLASSNYQKAIDNYLQLPESTSLYNNIALIYMSKFELERNESDFDKALENMDKAVHLASDDSVVLSNAADSYAVRTYRDILENEINFSVLNFRPSLNLFSYLYDDSATKDMYIEKIQAMPTYNKMMEYLRKASLLSPKDAQIFSNAYATYYFLRLEEDIKNLTARLNSIGLESDESLEDQNRYRSGESHTESVVSINESLSSFTQRYASLDKSKFPLERVVVDTTLIKMQHSLFKLGEKIDIYGLLKNAELNYKSHPSSATRVLYSDLLLETLILKSIANNAEFRDFYNQYERIYDRETLVAMALEGIDSYKVEAQKSDLFKPYVDALILSDKKFLEYPTASDWYFLHAIEHEYADGIKARYKGFNLGNYLRQINSLTSVNGEEATLMHYIELMILDEVDEAKKVVTEGRAAGLKLPEFLVL